MHPECARYNRFRGALAISVIPPDSACVPGSRPDRDVACSVDEQGFPPPCVSAAGSSPCSGYPVRQICLIFRLFSRYQAFLQCKKSAG